MAGVNFWRSLRWRRTWPPGTKQNPLPSRALMRRWLAARYPSLTRFRSNHGPTVLARALAKRGDRLSPSTGQYRPARAVAAPALPAERAGVRAAVRQEP